MAQGTDVPTIPLGRRSAVVGRSGKLWQLALGLAILAALVVVGPMLGYYNVFLLTTALIYSQLAMTLDLQWGYGGLINFGAAAPFGVGAYVYALLAQRGGLFSSAYLALAAAMAACVLFALVIGFPAFRARTLPLYYALLTLAAALLLSEYVTIVKFTNGSNGINGVPPLDLSLPPLFHFQPAIGLQSYDVTLGITAALFLVSWWLTRSPFGRAMRAMREDDRRCEALGYPILRYKLILSSFAFALAGLAGGLFAAMNGSIDPSLLGVALSLQAFIWVALGGQGTLWGPMVAAIAITLVQNYLSSLSANLYLVILSLAFVLGVLVLPGGLAGLLRSIVMKISRPGAAIQATEALER